MRRRTFLQTSIAALGGLLLAGCADDAAGEAPSRDGGPWLMPEEGTPHARTWLAFGASDRIWGADLVPTVQRDLALIATTIARFEPVSMLVPPAQMAHAQRLVSGSRVELVACELDDLWIRDTGPTFVKNGPTKAGVDFNFNGWGSKQRHRRDREVARFVAGRAGAPALRTDLVLEGGALEVDGEGTAIITESCVLNDNRNRGWTKAEVEDELRELLGIRKVIWLPGIAGEDITDGHTDFYARFARPGVVVAGLETDRESFDYDVTRKHLEILRGATDVHGNRLRVEVMESRRRCARSSRATTSRAGTSTSTCATAPSSVPSSEPPTPTPRPARRCSVCSPTGGSSRSTSTGSRRAVAVSTARRSRSPRDAASSVVPGRVVPAGVVPGTVVPDGRRGGPPIL